MKWFWIFYTIYWTYVGIATFCGVEFSVITLGCGCLMGALGCLRNALDK
jgi:hypothetical protein